MGVAYLEAVEHTGYTPSFVPGPASRLTRRSRSLILAGLLLFALVALYSSFAMITRVDQLFLPGKQLALPFSVPGVEGPPDALAAEDERINILRRYLFTEI